MKRARALALATKPWKGLPQGAPGLRCDALDRFIVVDLQSIGKREILSIGCPWCCEKDDKEYPRAQGWRTHNNLI